MWYRGVRGTLSRRGLVLPPEGASVLFSPPPEGMEAYWEGGDRLALFFYTLRAFLWGEARRKRR